MGCVMGRVMGGVMGSVMGGVMGRYGEWSWEVWWEYSRLFPTTSYNYKTIASLQDCCIAPLSTQPPHRYSRDMTSVSFGPSVVLSDPVSEHKPNMSEISASRI